METVSEFFDVLPTYIMLFYPGYLTIYLYFFFEGKRIQDTQWLFAKAVCLSYLYTQIIQESMIIPCANIEISKEILLAILGGSIGIVSAKFHDSKMYEKMLILIKRDRNYGTSEFDILSNEDGSIWVCVYLKNSPVIYEGSLCAEELERDVRRYIILGGYRKYKLKNDKKKIFLENHTGDNEEAVIIYYDEIQRIEKRKAK